MSKKSLIEQISETRIDIDNSVKDIISTQKIIKQCERYIELNYKLISECKKSIKHCEKEFMNNEQ